MLRGGGMVAALRVVCINLSASPDQARRRGPPPLQHHRLDVEQTGPARRLLGRGIRLEKEQCRRAHPGIGRPAQGLPQGPSLAPAHGLPTAQPPLPFFDKRRAYDLPDSVKAAGIYPYFRVIESAQDPEVIIGGKPLVMLGSNNYLGLTNHPKVKEAAIKAVQQFGTGCGGSRFLNGTLGIHEELEEKLAAFMRKPAAVTFSTGFQVNLGTIACLVDRRDVVYLDKQDHACIIDGARLGLGEIRKFKHNSPADLRRLMEADDEAAAWSSWTASTRWRGTSAPCPRSSRSPASSTPPSWWTTPTASASSATTAAAPPSTSASRTTSTSSWARSASPSRASAASSAATRTS